MKSKKDNIVIGIDTSCYTTSIAAISLNKEIILNEKIMLQVDKNSKGLRQSEAVFQHVSNIGKISENIGHKLKNYDIVGVCASKTPRPIKGSYMPVFTVGLNVAKLLSVTHDCLCFETTHQENHIKSSLLGKTLSNENRFIAVHMSGGTTEIVLVNKNESEKYEFEIIGGTKD
ncbi:MAG: O-sialoglycoprotein endopeptidase, partial [Intestinibacter sp.]|nr:O-sialoglycoprotein endopeptidase [Intestinibacter sp.]